MHKSSVRAACDSVTFSRRLIALAVASCFATGTALANPTGATVTSGSATITSSGSTLSVTNSPNTIINWHDFSINAGETTQFIQQSALSAVLNRITGGDPSLILGTLQSNGRVFLINPAGIVFGAGSVVNVAGLVASTLNITDADFLAGKHIYNANIVNPGNVTNAGEIRTPTGGFVYLIGTKVENSGVITTPSGEAILAAGNSVEIVDSTDPSQRVLVSAQSQDVNLSQLMLQNDGNIFGVLNSGRVSANSVTQDATGKIYFKSAGNIETTAGSITEARGSSTLDGGHIQAFADLNGSYSGTFDAWGRNGGFIETSGHYLGISGINVRANALDPSGTAGIWLLDPYDITISGSSTAYGGFSIGNPETFTPTGTGSNVYGGDIETALNGGTSVIIRTDGGGGTEAGNITVSATIAKSGGGDASLTLLANNDIIINGGYSIGSTLNKLNVILNADSDGNGSGAINMLYDTAGATISSNGGNIILGGGANPLTGSASGVFLDRANLDAGSGNIIINAASVTLNNSSEISGGTVAINTNGATALTDSKITSSGTLSLTTGSLTETRSSFGAPYPDPTPTFISINSNGDIVLNDGSDIVANNEVSITTLGKIYLNSGTSGESHISTYSNNTIFLYFPNLFSGGFVLDGIEGIFFSPFNIYTGFFTGTNLDTLAILNSNLFITYAPAGPITGIVGQNNTNTLATNPYLDPYGPNQTGPGDSSLTYGVSGGPWVNDGAFGQVHECS